MKDARVSGTYPAIILTGDSPEAYNEIDRPVRVVPGRTQLTLEKGVVRLAPHSLSTVKILGNLGL